MYLRRFLVAPAILFAFAALTGCGGNGSGITNPVAPPSGSFSNTNLKGTYVFSVSGEDANSAPYTLVGTFAANGSGGISSGAYDMNDAEFSSNSIAPVANQAITGGSYSVQVDGRTKITLNTTTPFGGSSGGASNITLDIVLQNSSHGLVIQFDDNATGSGTVDLQTSGATPTGTYAFSLSGSNGAGTEPLAAVGNFTVGSGITGLIDVNVGAILPYANEALTGSLALGPSSSPATILSSAGLNGTFDVVAIDATHLKFIEMDATNILVGDAYSQTSTAMPVGTQAFTLSGCSPCSSTSFTPEALGGFIVTDANGDITNASNEDYNVGGTSNISLTSSTNTSGSFTGSYAPTSSTTGRYVLSGFSDFVGGNTYAAYPSSGGLLLLEMDNAGLSFGAAYPQASGASFTASQGYGLNLTGTNDATGSEVEVDDIAEFTAATGGTLSSGVIDENYGGGSPNLGLALTSGAYTGPDASGRYFLSAAAGSTSNSTLNGGFNLVFYTADGVTFPFIDVDTGQVASGVFVQQSPSGASSSAAIKSTLHMAPPVFRPLLLKKKLK